MADRFLIDTSFWITVARRNPPPTAVERFAKLVAAQEAAVNEMIRLEVLVGSRTDDEYRLSADQLQALEVLTIDDAVWNQAAELGFRLRRAGITPGTEDLVVAATAMRYGATLVHVDSDFEAFAERSELVTESHLPRS